MFRKFLISLLVSIPFCIILMFGLSALGSNNYSWLIFWILFAIFFVSFNAELFKRFLILLKEYLWTRYLWVRWGLIVPVIVFFGFSIFLMFNGSIGFDFTKDLASYESSNLCSRCMESGLPKNECAQKACMYFYKNYGGQKLTDDEINGNAGGCAYQTDCEPPRTSSHELPGGRPNYFKYIFSSHNFGNNVFGIMAMLWMITIPVFIICVIVGIIIGIIFRKK